MCTVCCAASSLLEQHIRNTLYYTDTFHRISRCKSFSCQPGPLLSRPWRMTRQIHSSHTGRDLTYCRRCHVNNSHLQRVDSVGKELAYRVQACMQAMCTEQGTRSQRVSIELYTL